MLSPYHSLKHYTVGQTEKRGTLLLSISSPMIDQFSKFFHWHTLQTIRQFAIMSLLHIPPHGKCFSTLPCEIQM